jgi:predicted transposase YdaD
MWSSSNFVKTDKWFYELFLSQPGMLAELIPGIKADWEFVYTAPVVKEKEFRLDGLFMPISNDPLIPAVFAKAQMQPDERFYGRYFSQLFLQLYQYFDRRLSLINYSSPVAVVENGSKPDGGSR